MGAITSGKSGMTNPFKAKPPNPADFTTPGTGGGSAIQPGNQFPGNYPDKILRDQGITAQGPSRFDAFGFKKAEQRYAFQQEAVKNLQETFPIGADEDNPQADTSKFGSPMGEIDTSMQPGPSVPNMAKVDYGLLGTDPGILSEQWWRKQYGA